MTTTQTIPAAPQLRGDEMRRLLAGLCDRSHRAWISLHWESKVDRPVLVRLLAVDGDSLVTDHPRVCGHPLPMRIGERLRISIDSEHGLFQFETVVRDPIATAPGRPGSGLALELPGSVDIVQRRVAFRIGPVPAPEVTISPRTRRTVNQTWPLVGELVNISETGAALRAVCSGGLRIGDRCGVEIAVGGEDPLALTARVVREEPGVRRALFGVAWEFADDAAGRAARQRVSKFIAAEQRRARPAREAPRDEAPRTATEAAPAAPVARDARRHARLRCRLLNCALGDILDLSEAGLRTRCGSKPPVGPGDSFPITITGACEPFHASVRVVWLKKVGFRAHEIGMIFDSLDPLARKQVALLVAPARGTVAG